MTVTETKHSAVLTLVWLFRACALASSSAIQFAVCPQGTGKIFVLKSMAKLLLTLLIGWSSSSGSVLQLRGGSVRLPPQPLRSCYPSLALSWCFFDSAGGSIDHHSPTGFPSEPAQISGADEIGPTEPQPLQRRRRTQLFLEVFAPSLLHLSVFLVYWSQLGSREGWSTFTDEIQRYRSWSSDVFGCLTSESIDKWDP